LWELPFLCKIGCNVLPLDALEPEALKQAINSLDDEMVEIMSPRDGSIIKVKAWLKHLDNIMKLYEVHITTTATRWLTQKYDVTIHVKEVLEAGQPWPHRLHPTT
jgi:hypothetical protein